jgi:hypothetical protein
VNGVQENWHDPRPDAGAWSRRKSKLTLEQDGMALLGKAALAMWWDMAPGMRAEFEDWHSHEHFTERLGIPGFCRATRWSAADGGEGVFQMYELEAYETLASDHYLQRLNAPTPWSTRMMPHHRNMVRSQCRVLESAGGNVARHALTVRLSPAAARENELRAALKDIAAALAERRGCVGGHLLRHEMPAIAQTTEQKIRGKDRYADWVFVAVGYDAPTLQELAADELGAQALARAGAAPGAEHGLYTLSYSALPAERD